MLVAVAVVVTVVPQLRKNLVEVLCVFRILLAICGRVKEVMLHHVVYFSSQAKLGSRSLVIV